MRNIDEANEFIRRAVQDGWNIEPLYQNEPVESFAKLTCEDWTMYVNMRNPDDCEINIWGPDGLDVQPPVRYDHEQLHKNLRLCGECNTPDVDTSRVAFANRVCGECLPAARKRYERPGWYN